MPRRQQARKRYPPISHYALIGDCRSAALVSRAAAIDWCCMPRIDGGSQFGRLLDWDRGGSLELRLQSGRAPAARRYVDGTLVLETELGDDGGDGAVRDCMAVGDARSDVTHTQLLRIVECRRGVLRLKLRIAPRFDYGGVRPWIRLHAPHVHSAVGGDDGLVIFCDHPLTLERGHDLTGEVELRAGERLRLSLEFARPEELERTPPTGFEPEELDRRLEATVEAWRRWRSAANGLPGPESAGALQSALVLKALQYEPTGAIIAAPTTSLPEAPGGARNWDYRFSWIRDSSFSTRALAELGFEAEADAFRRFVQRAAAGSAEDLQVMYGVGGERRLVESELELEGWRGARPVRAGNAASGQLQLDALGELVNLAWRWHERGHSPDDDLWRFIVDLVDTAAARWDEPDAGIWEWRGDPQHFVHSKAMCWSALDKGLRLAEECMRKAPERRWKRARDEVRAAIEKKGFEKKRGTFVQAFGSRALDAAVLLLPTFGFVDWADDRMVSTVDVIRDGLDDGHGLLYRYSEDDGLGGKEGAFLACSFWLCECLAHQGRLAEAQEAFDRTIATSNDLGLFGEEYWSEADEIAGNFPQGLTHLAHIAAAVALNECRPRDVSAG